MYKSWRKNGHSFDLGRMSVRDLLAAFGSHPAVHLYLALALASFAVAAETATALGRPSLAVVVTAGAYPVSWYAIHRFILHGRFLYRLRLTAALWKRIHFDHHQDPHRMDVLFGSPMNTVPTLLVILVPLGWLVGGGLPGAASALSAGLLITCGYEFCHCIQHLNFRPRLGLLRRMKELHLAHHFHNEHGNYGITSFTVDRALGTFYGSVRERPRSPHVFNLGYDVAEAARFPWVAELSGELPRDRPRRQSRAPLAEQHAGSPSSGRAG